MNHIFKLEFYEEFSCIADRCSFTCCKGWEVIVDTDTNNKWKSDDKQSGYFCKKVKLKKYIKETEGYIKMGPHMCCPFLDDKGLCNIVINSGEDYLPNTCKMFPRQENSFGNLKEYSLSCACPAVVDMINSINGKMKLLYDGDENVWDNIPSAYKIREVMITMMQNSKFSLKDRILLIFNMLLSMKKELVITKEIISQYQDEKYLISLADIWSGIRIDYEDSSREIKEFFVDIVQNYRREKNFSKYLKDISVLAEDVDIGNTLNRWDSFSIAFGQYEQLIENCMVSKIFSNCISDDIDEMIISFQMLITEYVMIKYSTFLRWLMKERQSNVKKEIDYNDIKDYIVVYSRIIGYNADGIKEFWEDSFDEAVWEFGYMLLLI